MQTSSKALLWAIILTIVLAIGATYYIFLFKKNFEFTVEASCDPSKHVCFSRDCSAGECPPNELAQYRVFYVSAKDFQECADNSCLSECETGSINCEEYVCNSDEGYECTSITDSTRADVDASEISTHSSFENISTTAPPFTSTESTSSQIEADAISSSTVSRENDVEN